MSIGFVCKPTKILPVPHSRCLRRLGLVKTTIRRKIQVLKVLPVKRISSLYHLIPPPLPKKYGVYLTNPYRGIPGVHSSLNESLVCLTTTNAFVGGISGPFTSNLSDKNTRI